MSLRVSQFQFALFGINTYVVSDETTGDCAIIDPGMMNREEEEALAGYIRRNHFKVTHIINTHMHIDHVMGNAYCAKEFGAPIAAHKADAALGKNLEAQAAMFNLPFKVDNCVISQSLEDGDIVKIGASELHVLHIPGHSPGSIVLYDKEDGFVIAGDVLFQGSVGRSDLPGGSHEQLIAGIREKLLPLPDSTAVYPGHGPATTIGKERDENPFL